MVETSNLEAVPEDRPERKNGIAFVREAELYNLARLATDALREAEHLACEVQDQAFKVHVAQSRDSGTQVDAAEAHRRVSEALTLSYKGEHYLLMLRDAIAEQAGVDPWAWDRPSF